MIKLTLRTLPPTINSSYRRSKNSFYKAQEAKNASETVKWEVRAQYLGKPLIGPVEVRIRLWEASNRVDADARTKSLLDCLSGIVYLDDRQVKKYCVEQGVDRRSPRVEIEVVELKV